MTGAKLKLKELPLCCIFIQPVYDQGQTRGYGRITHFLQLPLEGHDFPRATVAKPIGRMGSVSLAQVNKA